MTNPADVAGAIAREAGALLLTFTAETKHTRKKGAVNLVTAADVASQELIVSRLNAAFPSHAVLAEENIDNLNSWASSASSASSHLWIVDPLDGTTNFSHGYPVFGVSIALSVNGRITVGVVFNPVSGELFTADRGRGATLNGQAIRVTKTAEVNDALLVTGVPYWIREKPERIMAKFKAFSVRAQGVRRSGAASIDMCEVAAGRADGFWEEGLAPWDTAAGSIIIAEAGGRLTNMSGGDFDIYEPEVLASNGLIHMEMLEIVRHARHERL